MADDFNLDDALFGQTNVSGQQNQSQGQNLNNPWGGPGQPYPGGYAPGQQYPGAPPGGQQYPGAPPGGQQYPGAPPGGQQYPGAPPGGQQYPGAPPGGQQYPGGYPAPGPGQQYPGAPPGGQPYPGGYPAPGSGQQYPGVPPGGQPYPGGIPGYPGFPAPVPGQPTDPKTAGQSGPIPSAPPGPLKLPYALPLPAGVMPGLVMTFNGVINSTAKRWSIDLKKDNDIVFHCNPRFDENPNVTVRNSMIRGQWGAEERTASKFPFQKGQQFMMQIFCEPEGYRVVCNNENLFTYKHRDRDFQQIRSAHVNGDLTLNGASVTRM